MKELNPNLAPPSGFRFTDSDQSLHLSSSLDYLVFYVQAYRRRVGLPAGEPLREITDQICKRNPHVCRDGGNKAPAVYGEALLEADVVQNTHTLHQKKLAGGLILAPKEDLVARVEGCQRCKFNVAWQSSCPTCEKGLEVIRKEVLGHREPVEALKGRACLNARDDLSVAVHVHFTEKRSDVPKECWRCEIPEPH